MIRHDRIEADTARAVQAATELATQLGVRSDAPTVLSNGSNVILHLTPAPVVARVATLTALVRPAVAANLANDLALADYLADQGAPVVAPSRELPPGPHHADGYTITFWTYVPHEPRHTWQPAEVGPLLADLHTAMRGFPGELQDTPPIEVAEVLSALRRVDAFGPLTETDTANLLADATAVTNDIMNTDHETVPLHGDAHPGNLLCTPDGPVWTDFEDAWRGPLGWDLACLALTSRLDGRAALVGYPHAHEELAPFLAGRRLQTLVWSLVFCWRFPTEERTHDANHRLQHWRTSLTAEQGQ
ncbi:MAG TPA: aminoglycoside phosphotransferase family protein [Pseudonocardiaceae bacterium]|jgi:Ser/Thr protein kinase RdoA (MazF antagonist)|nr:aminoglycoside phosphotransferase family protein [Pseudonocardiaceae bacterium]